jgi:hypothetical protein
MKYKALYSALAILHLSITVGTIIQIIGNLSEICGVKCDQFLPLVVCERLVIQHDTVTSAPSWDLISGPGIGCIKNETNYS